MLLTIAFSNCGASGTTKPACESDAGIECNCDEEDVHTLVPEIQQTVTCSTGTHLEGNECIANEVEGLDQDGDGFPYPEDCDDKRIDVNPAAEEICDARDNDCDGEIDGEGICLYECLSNLTECNAQTAENEVSITLTQTTIWWPMIYMSGCKPGHPNLEPFFIEPPDTYVIRFAVSNLEAGDTIEKFIIKQTAGETPIPSSWWQTGEGGNVGNLEVDYLYYSLGEHYDLYQTHQNEEGNFVFENITIPEGETVQWLEFRTHIDFDYTGYLQLSFVEATDFQVSNKTTITQLCGFPQQGEYVMILCPDRDNDGQDDERCGGTDPDDQDHYPGIGY